MDRETALEVLRQHANELRAAGVARLRLFGSVARGEATNSSDVDLLAEFDASRCITLVTLGSLEARIEGILGTTVDLSAAAWMRENVRNRALEEAVLVF